MEIHLADFSWPGAGARPVLQSEGSSVLFGPDRPPRFYFWTFSGKRDAWPGMVELVKAASPGAGITIVPVAGGQEPCLDGAWELIGLARKAGLRPGLSRSVPLCVLDGGRGRDLLNADALEKAEQQEQASRFQVQADGRVVPAGDSVEIWQDISWPGFAVVRQEAPFAGCTDCGLLPLGFCSGGFFSDP